MKPPQFFITLILSSICVVLSLIAIQQGRSLNDLQNSYQDTQMKAQSELQGLQAEVNKGQQMQQFYNALIKEIAGASYDQTGKVKNVALTNLLKNNGWTLTVNQPQASPTPKPTP